MHVYIHTKAKDNSWSCRHIDIMSCQLIVMYNNIIHSVNVTSTSQHEIRIRAHYLYSAIARHVRSQPYTIVIILYTSIQYIACYFLLQLHNNYIIITNILQLCMQLHMRNVTVSMHNLHVSTFRHTVKHRQQFLPVLNCFIPKCSQLDHLAINQQTSRSVANITVCHCRVPFIAPCCYINQKHSVTEQIYWNTCDAYQIMMVACYKVSSILL